MTGTRLRTKPCGGLRVLDRPEDVPPDQLVKLRAYRDELAPIVAAYGEVEIVIRAATPIPPALPTPMRPLTEAELRRRRKWLARDTARFGLVNWELPPPPDLEDDERSAGMSSGGRYAPRPTEERERVARDCLEGQNQHRERYAAEIRAGDLFGPDGLPKYYWHCLATEPPPSPTGRRGRWKAGEDETSIHGGWIWGWDDYGPTARCPCAGLEVFIRPASPIPPAPVRPRKPKLPTDWRDLDGWRAVLRYARLVENRRWVVSRWARAAGGEVQGRALHLPPDLSPGLALAELKTHARIAGLEVAPS